MSIVTCFLHVCKIAACERSLSVSLCDNRESGFMLMLLLCSAICFLILLLLQEKSEAAALEGSTH